MQNFVSSVRPLYLSSIPQINVVGQHVFKVLDNTSATWKRGKGEETAFSLLYS